MEHIYISYQLKQGVQYWLGVMDTRQEKAQVRVSCSSGKKLRSEDDSVCKRSDVGCDMDPFGSHPKVIEGSRGK